MTKNRRAGFPKCKYLYFIIIKEVICGEIQKYKNAWKT